VREVEEGQGMQLCFAGPSGQKGPFSGPFWPLGLAARGQGRPASHTGAPHRHRRLPGSQLGRSAGGGAPTGWRLRQHGAPPISKPAANEASKQRRAALRGCARVASTESRQQQMDGGGGDEAGAGDASNPVTARRPAAPTPLSKKRYKKLGTVMDPLSIANC